MLINDRYYANKLYLYAFCVRTVLYLYENHLI